jgi:hypothetical protein
MITTVTYYRNHVEVTRNVVVSVPTLSSGNQVSYENEAATAAPVPHRAEIETSVTYSATMTKQRYRIDLETPELPETNIVVDAVVWDTENVFWDTEEVVWL